MSLIKVDQSKIIAKQVEEAKRNRAAAYTAEADPLFFKWHADEITKEEWQAKREEIRDRFPYPKEESSDKN